MYCLAPVALAALAALAAAGINVGGDGARFYSGGNVEIPKGPLELLWNRDPSRFRRAAGERSDVLLVDEAAGDPSSDILLFDEAAGDPSSDILLVDEASVEPAAANDNPAARGAIITTSVHALFATDDLAIAVYGGTPVKVRLVSLEGGVVSSFLLPTADICGVPALDDDGTVLFYVGTDILFQVDIKTGRADWSLPVELGRCSNFAADPHSGVYHVDGELYLMDKSRHFVVVSVASRSIVFSSPVPGALGLPVVDEFSSTFFHLVADSLVAISRGGDGAQLWRVDMSSKYQPSLSTDRQLVFAVALDQTTITAVEAATGALRWTTDLGGRVSELTISGTPFFNTAGAFTVSPAGQVVVMTAGTVFVLSQTLGHVELSFGLGGRAFSVTQLAVVSPSVLAVSAFSGLLFVDMSTPDGDTVSLVPFPPSWIPANTQAAPIAFGAALGVVVWAFGGRDGVHIQARRGLYIQRADDQERGSEPLVSVSVLGGGFDTSDVECLLNATRAELIPLTPSSGVCIVPAGLQEDPLLYAGPLQLGISNTAGASAFVSNDRVSPYGPELPLLSTTVFESVGALGVTTLRIEGSRLPPLGAGADVTLGAVPCVVDDTRTVPFSRLVCSAVLQLSVYPTLVSVAHTGATARETAETTVVHPEAAKALGVGQSCCNADGRSRFVLGPMLAGLAPLSLAVVSRPLPFLVHDSVATSWSPDGGTLYLTYNDRKFVGLTAVSLDNAVVFSRLFDAGQSFSELVTGVKNSTGLGALQTSDFLVWVDVTSGTEVARAELIPSSLGLVSPIIDPITGFAIVCDDLRLLAITATGSVALEVALPSDCVLAPAVSSTRDLILAVVEDQILAIDRNGSLVWSLSQRRVGAAAISDLRSVVVGTAYGPQPELFGLSLETGEPLFRTAIPGNEFLDPVMCVGGANDTYVSYWTGDHEVYVVSLESLEVLHIARTTVPAPAVELRCGDDFFMSIQREIVGLSNFYTAQFHSFSDLPLGTVAARVICRTFPISGPNRAMMSIDGSFPICASTDGVLEQVVLPSLRNVLPGSFETDSSDEIAVSHFGVKNGDVDGCAISGRLGQVLVPSAVGVFPDRISCRILGASLVDLFEVSPLKVLFATRIGLVNPPEGFYPFPLGIPVVDSVVVTVASESDSTSLEISGTRFSPVVPPAVTLDDEIACGDVVVLDPFARVTCTVAAILAAGTHTAVIANQEDPALSQTSSPVMFSVEPVLPPLVLGLSPTSGPTNVVPLLTIVGRNFALDLELVVVRGSGTPLDVVSLSDRQVVVVGLPGDPGDAVELTLEVVGVSPVVDAGAFVYLPPFSASGVSPPAAVAGAPVVVSGTLFLPESFAQCRWTQGADAVTTPGTVLSSSQVACTAPATLQVASGVASPAGIDVEVGLSVDGEQFSYVPVPGSFLLGRPPATLRLLPEQIQSFRQVAILVLGEDMLAEPDAVCLVGAVQFPLVVLSASTAECSIRWEGASGVYGLVVRTSAAESSPLPLAVYSTVSRLEYVGQAPIAVGLQGAVPELEFALFDAFNVSVPDPVPVRVTAAGGANVTLLSPSVPFAEGGSVTIDDLVVVGVRGSTVELVITAFDDDGLASASAQIPVLLVACEDLSSLLVASDNNRSCLCAPGTVDEGAGACIPCPAGTFSDGATLCRPCPADMSTSGDGVGESVDDCTCDAGFYRDPRDSTRCLACPDGLECLGGGAPSRVEAGFFLERDSLGLVTVHRCPDSRLCLEDGECRPGHTGFVCARCLDGYEAQSGLCLKCPSVAFNIATATVMLLVALGVGALMCRSIHGKVSEWSVSLQITISLLQTIAYLGDLRVRWPDALLGLFRYSSSAGLDGSAFVPALCLLKTDGLSTLRFMMLLPLFVSMLVATGYGGLRMLGGHAHLTVGESTRRFGASVVYLLLLVHPSVTKTVLRSLQCTTVGSVSFMTDDAEVDCRSEAYRVHRAVALTYLALYVVSLPVLLGFRLSREHGKGGQHFLSFLERGFRPESPLYLGEFWVLGRKLLVVLLSVVFDDVGLQIYFGLLLAFAVSHIHAWRPPFERDVHNRQETMATITLFVVYAAAVLYEFDVDPRLEQGAIFASIALVLGVVTVIIVPVAVRHMAAWRARRSRHFVEAAELPGGET